MVAIGFDGNPIQVGSRVELSSGMDRWMMGDRFGTVKSIRKVKDETLLTVTTDNGFTIRLTGFNVRLLGDGVRPEPLTLAQWKKLAEFS